MNCENEVVSQGNYVIGEVDIPKEYKPLSPWAYLGYNILFSLPIIGLIFLIIYSFNDENIARRNYARSFWVIFAITLVLTILVNML